MCEREKKMEREREGESVCVREEERERGGRGAGKAVCFGLSVISGDSEICEGSGRDGAALPVPLVTVKSVRGAEEMELPYLYLW